MSNAAPPIRIFLRDDDVGTLTPELERFVDIFNKRQLPVSYQVIPTQLDASCAAYLRARRASAPKLIEYGQHGLTHEMIVNGKRVFYEFGPERSYDEQLAIIREGQQILRDQLGSDFDAHVFTPPQHKYDRNTLKALAASGVQVLSASNYPDPGHRAAYAFGRLMGWSSIGKAGISYHGQTRADSGLKEISIAVPVDNGSRRMTHANDVIASIEKARRYTAVVGLMFHHNAYGAAADRAFLNEVADLLVHVPNASFHLLSDLSVSRPDAALN